MTTKCAGLPSKLTTTRLPGTKETVADTFVRRTGEGLGALVGIASASSDTRRASERAGYIAASAINVVSSTFGWETPRRVSKTVLMSLLAVNVWRRHHETSCFTTTTLLTGLAGDWLGDLALMPNKPNLDHGSVLFATNQLTYHVLLRCTGARISTLCAAVRFPLWAGSVSLVGAVRPEALPAVVDCSPLLAVISTLAGNPTLLKGVGAVGIDEQAGLPIVDVAYDLGHGGSLSLTSDTLLMARKIFAGEGIVGRLLNVAVMGTYIVVRLFLVGGLLALDRA